ncbi:hypothetical protein CMI42_04575 [Candidatus Pacearchaeota archaeon]|nr:hypothetical protein [Candidatus Pacearchaeota archaeon]
MNIHMTSLSNISRRIIMNDPIRRKIISYLGKEKVITSNELAKVLSVSWNTSEKYLLELAVERLVVKIKKEGVNLWMLK